jgi:hypothetical protein
VAVRISSYRNASDLVMIHMISVKNSFSLSLAVCLDSSSDTSASVFAGPGLNGPPEPAGPEATDCTAGPHGC